MITQIGSLPFDSVEQAVAYSLRHDIPFLPELPRLGDAMLDYIKNPGKLSCLAQFKAREFSTVKIQCVGPATLVMAGYTSDEALSRIVEHLSAVTEGLKSEKTILFLDEPALGQAGFDFEKLWAPIFESFNAVAGVHCCGNADWDHLFRSPAINFVSFDATQFDVTLYPCYRSGKKIAWGVESSKDVKDFQPGDLLTLPCGMGPKKYAPGDCERELTKLKQIRSGLIAAREGV